MDCIHPELALKALEKSQASLAHFGDGEFGREELFPKAKLFTSLDIGTPPWVEKVPIPHLGSGEAVSRWMLLDYCRYIDTTHLLNIQADGFIVNGDAWDPEWYQYDYIGAPWKLHPHHYWPPFPNVTETNCVGNGGFSLRSRSLMIQAAMLFATTIEDTGRDKPENYHPEDCWICRTEGTTLRQLGYKFAPLEVASKFSVENAEIVDQFGFHGKLTMKINPNMTKL